MCQGRAKSLDLLGIIDQLIEFCMPGTLIAIGLCVMAHFGTTRGIYIRAECDLTGVQFELIGLVFIIRIFDIKLFTTTERAFHNSIPNKTTIGFILFG